MKNNNELKNIPKLRFPQFQNDGEWNKKNLGNKDVSMFVKERESLNNLTLEKYVSTENLLPDYTGVKRSSKLPPAGSFIKFKTNDILISNIRPYLKKVWLASWSGASSNDVIVIRNQDKVSNKFLAHLLINDDFINYIMKTAKGVKMPRGDISSMKEYPISFPKPPEQEKIANCLSSIDDLIIAEEKKVELLRNHKKGLMQQLFPNEEV